MADRPSERRVDPRTAVVWEALEPLLSDGRRQVVDVGGGTGGFAVRIAELGPDVTVRDPSPDALAAAERRARERGLAERVRGQQGDLTDLVGLVGAGSADMVLCHGVLGLVAEPAAALDGIATVLRPEGVLSLLVGQLHAAVVARAMGGHLAEARELPDRPHSTPGARGADRRFTAAEAERLVAGAGFDVRRLHAVRVFADLVPATVLEAEAGAARALLELERAVAERPDYLTLAAQVHLLASR
jgi:S-adenosylmethionine-dependent methyltransferase